MPDGTTDLAALAAQVRTLGGDLDRRFEQSTERFAQLSSRLEESNARIEQLQVGIQQLNGRLETLTTTRKQSLAFAAALDGTWVGGNTSPQATLPAAGGPFLVAKGTMPVVLPSLSRIVAFRTSVRLSGLSLGELDLSFVSKATIGLQRTGLNPTASEPIVQLSGFLPSVRTGQGTPIAGRELVDTDLFQYSVTAEFFVPNVLNTPFALPQGFVVLDRFEVDCVVA